MSTIRLTMAQALIKFIDQQYIECDGKEHKFVKGVFGIFGHGNVTGLGEALENTKTELTYIQGHNEQGMVHTATAFAKQKNRLEIFACTSSIGPGATNMITGAATATSNRIPVLLLPGDVFSCRQPDPVFQQIEDPTDYTVTVNDCFKPVSRYWDRIERPEQIMSALNNAFRVLTDPVDTGAVTLCLPQDVQAEAFDYPVAFFEKKIWHLDRRPLSERALKLAIQKIKSAQKPVIIAGGGVHYSFACEDLQNFAKEFGMPVAETLAGKSAMSWEHPMSLGGVGVLGTEAANHIVQEADLILAIGTRLSDFTTTSKWKFGNADTEILHLNVSSFDGYKMGATLLQADAKEGLNALQRELSKDKYATSKAYQDFVSVLRSSWHKEVDRLYQIKSSQGNVQTAIVGAVNDFVQAEDVIVGAAGSLPGDLHRLWRCTTPKSYHMEYGYSCMGYEVAGGFGAKLAHPDREVYVIVGDGSFLMMHSELLTSIQEGYKINVIILDNHGFQCIKNLQMSQGSKGFGTEFRYRSEQTKHIDGDYLSIDFAGYAKSLGCKSYFANTVDDLKDALKDAKNQPISTVIEIKTLPGTMSGGYRSWWRVGVAEVSNKNEVEEAHQEMNAHIKETRAY